MRSAKRTGAAKPWTKGELRVHSWLATDMVLFAFCSPDWLTLAIESERASERGDISFHLALLSNSGSADNQIPIQLSAMLACQHVQAFVFISLGSAAPFQLLDNESAAPVIEWLARLAMGSN